MLILLKIQLFVAITGQGFAGALVRILLPQSSLIYFFMKMVQMKVMKIIEMLRKSKIKEMKNLSETMLCGMDFMSMSERSEEVNLEQEQNLYNLGFYLLLIDGC